MSGPCPHCAGRRFFILCFWNEKKRLHRKARSASALRTVLLFCFLTALFFLLLLSAAEEAAEEVGDTGEEGGYLLPEGGQGIVDFIDRVDGAQRVLNRLLQLGDVKLFQRTDQA